MGPTLFAPSYEDGKTVKGLGVNGPAIYPGTSFEIVTPDCHSSPLRSRTNITFTLLVNVPGGLRWRFLGQERLR